MTVAAVVIGIALSGCGDDDHAATESDRLNAFFYQSSGADPVGEVYLGEVTGISACQGAARSFAA